MLEQVVIGILFGAALLFLGRRFYKSVFVKDAGCGKGCGCSGDSTQKDKKVKIGSPKHTSTV
jgi:hypothetical protein